MHNAETIEVPSTARHEPMMWLNTDRVLYVGLAGEPSERTLGAYSIYMSLNKPHRIRVDGGVWEEAELSVVPPYVPHSIVAGERMFCNILIEFDSVNAAALPAFIAHGCGAIRDVVALASLQRALGAFQRSAMRQFPQTSDFDRAFFGEVLATRAVDRRIGAVLARIKDDPNSPTSAQDCAEATHLSVSRFLHLFKAEAGTPSAAFAHGSAPAACCTT